MSRIIFLKIVQYLLFRLDIALSRLSRYLDIQARRTQLLSLTYYIIFRFGLSTQLQLILHPQVIHPLTHIVLTASILMIVALSFERYCAVQHPEQYREVLKFNGFLRFLTVF